MHITQNPDTNQKLLHSVEMGYYRRQLTILGTFYLVWCAISFLNDPAMGITFSIIFLPVLFFYLFRIFQILRERDSYLFCTVTLDQPNYLFWCKSYAFTVTLEHPQIPRCTRKTRAIFSPYGFFEPLLVSYVNQSVTVAFNPVTDTLVVIG